MDLDTQAAGPTGGGDGSALGGNVDEDLARRAEGMRESYRRFPYV